jgi:hypothetical protein
MTTVTSKSLQNELLVNNDYCYGAEYILRQGADGFTFWLIMIIAMVQNTFYGRGQMDLHFDF